MSRPVSIIVWRDARTEPPTGDMRRLVLRAVSKDGYRHLVEAQHVGIGGLWAEYPGPSDLTDEDMREAIDVYEKKALSSGAVDMRPFRARVDRLHAALGGEKEET